MVIGGLTCTLAVYFAFEVGAIYGCHETPAIPPERVLSNEAIRIPLFVDPAEVRYGSRFRFTFDPADVLAQYRKAENLDAIVAPQRSEFDRTLALMHWTSSQWELGRPDPYPPIDALTILRDIRAGRTGGFCAQYNYVFVQAVQSFGRFARYVTIQGHEVAEVWIGDLGKWVCFDPTHDAYYVDRSGVPLSVYEIYASLRRGAPVTMVGQPRSATKERHLAKFKRFAVWLKNDHVSAPINFEDIRHYRVYFIESPEDLEPIPDASLHTSALSDLYFDPTTE